MCPSEQNNACKKIITFANLIGIIILKDAKKKQIHAIPKQIANIVILCRYDNDVDESDSPNHEEDGCVDETSSPLSDANHEDM